MKSIKIFIVCLFLVGAAEVYSYSVIAAVAPSKISLTAGDKAVVKNKDVAKQSEKKSMVSQRQAALAKQQAANKQKALDQRKAEFAKQQAAEKQVEKQKVLAQRQAAQAKKKAADKQKALDQRKAEVVKRQAAEKQAEKQKVLAQRQAAQAKQQAADKQKVLDQRKAEVAKQQAAERQAEKQKVLAQRQSASAKRQTTDKQKTIAEKAPRTAQIQSSPVKTTRKTKSGSTEKTLVGANVTALIPETPTSDSKAVKTVVTTSARSAAKNRDSRPTYAKNLKNFDKDPVPAVSDTVSLVGIAVDVVSLDAPGAVMGGIVFVTGKSISATDPNNQTQIDDILSNVLAAGTTVASMLIAGSTAITASSVVAAAGFGFSVYSAHTAVQKALGIDGIVGDLAGQAYVALTEDSEAKAEYEAAVHSAAARQAREAADSARRALEGARRAGNGPEVAGKAQEAVDAAEQAAQAADDDDVPAAAAAANRARAAAQFVADAALGNDDVTETTPSQNPSGNTTTDTPTTDTPNTENTQSSASSETANTRPQGNGNNQRNENQNSTPGTATISDSHTEPDGSYSYKYTVTNSAGEVVDSGTTNCSGGNCIDVSDIYGPGTAQKDERGTAPENGDHNINIATGSDSSSGNNGNSQSNSSQTSGSDGNSSQDNESNDDDATDDDSDDNDSDDDSSGECQAGDANCTNDSEDDGSEEEPDTTEEEEPSTDSTPNPNAADENAADVIKFYEQTGGRIGGEAVQNQQRAIELNRSGGGVTDPVDSDEGTSGYSEHDDENIQGKSGGHVDGGRDQEAPREVTAQEMEDIIIRAGGGFTDPTDTGNTGGQAPSGPQSPKSPVGGIPPIVGSVGAGTTNNDDTDGDEGDQLQGGQQAPQSSVQEINVDTDAIKQNLQNRIQR